jgi:hypothetical protein
VPPKPGDRFTRIEVAMFAGRGAETKRDPYRTIVRNLEPFGVPPSGVKIVLIEVPMENWGIRGGRAASDIADLGFDARI